MPDTTEKEYVLGTHDEEIARLGLQHRVWRPYSSKCWQRAGFTVGQRLIDVGAGPGLATSDLAEIVGPSGKVLALERSQKFCDHNRASCQIKGLDNVKVVQMDLVEDEIPEYGFDGAWCRWVMSFVVDPARVIRKVAKALNPGSNFALHEYVDYASWRAIPPAPLLEKFRTDVMLAWREAGGEPDVAAELPPILRDAGFDVVRAEPIVFTVQPKDYGWRWPAAFVNGNSKHMEEQGAMSHEDAEALRAEFAEMEADPHSIILSPVVLEIIAVKR